MSKDIRSLGGVPVTPIPALGRANRRPRRSPLVVAGVAAALATAPLLVGCEDEQTFEAQGSYSPAGALDFGFVNVAEEITQTIVVTNIGSAGLRVESTRVDGTPGVENRFLVEVGSDLTSALTPGLTSTITVTYRPCPPAWNNDQRIPDFDLTECPGEPEVADLIITDNSAQQPTRTIALTGQPVQPPELEIRCVQAAGLCNMPNATRSQCVGLRFGSLVAGTSEPCDLYVEVVNKNRSDMSGNPIAVGRLVIDRMQMLVQDFRETSAPLRTAEEAGLSFLSENEDTPLSLPIEVDVPPGSDEGSFIFRVRFTGETPGDFIGSESEDLGLRVFHNDPDPRDENGIRTILLSASGSAPDIDVQPRLIDFGPIAQGTTATSTLTIRNEGDADLMVTGAALAGAGNTEFAIASADGNPIARTVAGFGQSFDILVSYSPTDPSNDREFLEVSSNDPNENPFTVEIRGGPTPRFCFEPRSGVLEFPIPDPPTGEARTREVSLESCGTGNLSITRLEIRNAGNPESVDDFAIGLPECAGQNPCTVNFELCPETDPTCTVMGAMVGISQAVPIVYQNNDTSRQDLADLIVTTNDPSLQEVTITLDASDNPCLPPRPIVTRVTNDPCVPQAVVLNTESSDPGGPIGGNTTITNCEWEMVFGSTTVFSPNNSADSCMMTSFLPIMPGGFHAARVTMTNSCGASATSPQETITVRQSCN